MPKTLRYHKGHQHFSCRVAAVIRDGSGDSGRVLLHRAAQDAFWSLPGGKVELGEEAAQAVRRELREELGCDVEVERLLWLVENFFEHEGEKHHELGLYFLARLPQGSPVLESAGPFERVEAQHQPAPLPLVFQWFPCRPELLAALDIRPAFLRDGLVQIPNEIQNVKITSVKS